MLPTQVPYLNFTDRDGQPLDEGSIYFGVANANPVTSPIPLFWDFAGTQPAAQPIKTIGGYPVHFGTPATVFASTSSYSISVYDKKGRLVYTAPDAEEYNVFSILADSDDPSKGAGMVGYKLPTTNTVGRKVSNKLDEWVSVKDFGAVGDGAADDTQAIINAIAGGLALYPTGVRVLFPSGTYKTTASIERPSRVFLEGDGMWATEIACTADAPVIRAVGTALAPINNGGVYDMTIRGSGKANANAVGIYENWPNRTVIENVQFFSCAKGTWLQNAWQCEWRNVTAHGAGTDQNEIGFYLHETDTGLVFPNNTVMAVNCVAQNCSLYGFRLMHFHGSKFINCEAAGGASIGWFLGSPVSNFTTEIMWGFFSNCLSDSMSTEGWRLERGGAPSFKQCGFANIWAGNCLTNSIHLLDCSEITFNGIMGVAAGQNQIRLERSARVAVSGAVLVDFDAGSVGSDGIALIDSTFNSFTGCQVRSAFGIGKSFKEYGTSDSNNVTGGVVGNGMTLLGANTRVGYVVGFATILTGSDIVAAGATSQVVAHGAGFTPTENMIRLTPRDPGGAATKWWVSAVSATTFTISVDIAPGGGGALFAWQIIR